MSDALAACIARPALAGASWGVCVQRRGTDADLLSHNADTFLVPASNTKLFTLAAAQDRLGSTLQLRTEFWLEDVAAAAKRSGNRRLAFVGGGDPTLVWGDLLAVAEATAGVLPAGGAPIDIELHVGGFGRSPLPGSWYWTYLEDSSGVGGPPSAVSVDKNLIEIAVLPSAGAAGEPAVIEWAHSTDRDSMRLINRVVTTAGAAGVDVQARYIVDDSVVHAGDGGSQQPLSLELSGGIPLGTTAPLLLKVQALAPDQRAGALLTEALHSHGLRAGSVSVIVPAEEEGGEDGQWWRTAAGEEPGKPGSGEAAAATLVHVVESAPMSELIRNCMQPSDNFLAELIFRLLAATDATTAANQPGSSSSRPNWATTTADWAASSAGSRVVTAAADHAGVDTRGMRLVDGSGVSIQNMLIPRATVQLLQAKADDPEWHSYMAVAGESGTLSARFHDTPAQGKLHGKTGTLDGVSALSGYVGDLLFYIMVGNVAHQQSHAQIVEAVDAVALAVCELADDSQPRPLL